MAADSRKKLSKRKATAFMTVVTVTAIAAVWLALVFQMSTDTKLTSQANANANVENRDTEIHRIIEEVVVIQRPEEDEVTGNTYASAAAPTAANSTAPAPAIGTSRPQLAQIQPAPRPTTRAS